METTNRPSVVQCLGQTEPTEELVDRMYWDSLEILRAKLNNQSFITPTLLARLPNIKDTDKFSLEKVMQAMRLFLTSEVDVQSIPNLNGDDAQCMADLLDGVMYFFDVSDRQIHERAFHSLRKLSARSACLPASFYILSSKLSRIGDNIEGNGGYGIVYKGKYEEHDVALKQLIRKSDNTNVFYKEAVVCRYLRHPNIVPFLGVENRPDPRLRLVSAWMPGGCVREYIKGNPNSNRQSLIMNVALGLEYLHCYRVVHGDLKGDNILIDSNGRARLADFGLACVMYSEDTLNTRTTTPEGQTERWAAPEVLEPDKFGVPGVIFESDIHSFGMVMLEIFSGEIPYVDILRPTNVRAKIVNGDRPSRPNATDIGLSDEVWKLIERCWDQHWGNRPSMLSVVEVLQHAFKVVLAVSIPAAQHPAIIGKHGIRVKALQERTGTQVLFPTYRLYNTVGTPENLTHMMNPPDIVKVVGKRAACKVAIDQLRYSSDMAR